MQAFHNTPSAGYIAWQDVHIQYKGTTYNIPNGNTDKRYVIWKYADPDAFYGSDEFPTLGPDDLLVFLNKNGTYAIVPRTQIVDGSLIVSDSIMTDAIAANAVTTAKIAAGAITADLIAANAIGAGAIAAGAVTADKIAAGEIATTHLAALAVTADKIAANSVTADKVAANAIGAEKIAAGAISADKLAAGAVTAEKIAAGAISTDKLSIGLADTIEATPRTIAPDTETYFPFDGGLASTRGAQPTFTRASTATNPETGAIVATDEPRFVEGRFGGQAVLVEEGTTNLAVDCSAFDTASWTRESFAGTITANATTAPDGTQTADQINMTSGYVYQTKTLTAGQTYTFSCWVKSATGADIPRGGIDIWGYNGALGSRMRASDYRIITPSWQRLELSYTVAADETSFVLTVAAPSRMTSPYNVYVWGAQCEAKPYATSFVDGTRAGETLSIPTSGVMDDISAWTIEFWGRQAIVTGRSQGWFDGRWTPGIPVLFYLDADKKLGIYRLDENGNNNRVFTGAVINTPGSWHHYGITYAAGTMRVYLDGSKVGEVSTTLKANSGTAAFRLGYDSGGDPVEGDVLLAGLRIHRRALSDEEIAAHAQAATAPYDPRALVGAIDADVRPVRLMGNQITLDSTGLKMKNVDSPIVMMHLDANRLGFWDPTTGDPSIGIGDVADMATALGSDMEYGLLLAQGEIRATEAVIRKSLAQGLVGQKHVEDGSVTLKKLSDLLSVTIPDRFQLYAGKTLETANKLTNPGFETGSLTGWTGTGTVVSSAVHSGSYAVNKANIYQDTPASSGQVWVGQAWVKGSGSGGQEYVTLQFLNASKTVLSTSNSPTGPLGWKQLRVVGVAPANTAYARLLIKSVGTDTTHRFDDCLLAQEGVSSTYVTFASATISQTEACEQIKVNTEIDNPDGATIYTRVLVNGTTKLETSSAVATVTASLTLDVRSITGDITVQAQAKTSGSGAVWTKAEIMTNQRLPLRGASPRYAVTSSTESSCGTTCEAACQAPCQKACEADCQKTCQQDCQTSCQSICEQTSQGGGCWVAGTPVTVYLPKSETATDIPVEQLEPGMRMPYYDPATDALAITECLSNLRSYTHTIYVAEVEGGWVLEMTGEQPMDVLRAHLVTGQIMWHRVQARYLRVGDKLVRPFDKTLHEVLSVREESRARTWVWNPRTEARRYIVHGFADGISKT